MSGLPENRGVGGSIPPLATTAVSGAELADRVQKRLDVVGQVSNSLGAVTVVLFLVFLTPTTINAAEFRSLMIRSVVAFVVYMPLSLFLGRRMGRRKGEEGPRAPLTGAGAVEERSRRGA